MRTTEETFVWNEPYKQLAKLVGAAETLKIYQEFRGLQVNFPVRLIAGQYIGEIVYAEYDGKNLATLARRYGYSERHLRRLIQKEKQEQDDTSV